MSSLFKKTRRKFIREGLDDSYDVENIVDNEPKPQLVLYFGRRVKRGGIEPFFSGCVEQVLGTDHLGGMNLGSDFQGVVMMSNRDLAEDTRIDY